MYNEQWQLIALLRDEDRLEMLQQINEFKYEPDHAYTLSYRLKGTGKLQYINFNDVSYISETKSYTFKLYDTDYPSSKLTDQVNDSITLKNYEIVSYEKQNLNDSYYSRSD